MPSVTTWFVLAVLAAPTLVLAHGDGLHARGTVREITQDRLVVGTVHGRDVVFTLAPDTTYERGKAPARRDDVKIGERVIVHGRRAGDHEVAAVVRLAPAPRHR